jgi:hypothetical protein
VRRATFSQRRALGFANVHGYLAVTRDAYTCGCASHSDADSQTITHYSADSYTERATHSDTATDAATDAARTHCRVDADPDRTAGA